MKVYTIVFSPTGGTGAVMDVLAKQFEIAGEINLCANVADADFIRLYDKVESCDLCLIAVPVYGGRIPAIAAKRLKLLDGKGAKAVCTVVYGNRDYEDALLELVTQAKAAGFRPIAGITAIAEHSLVRSIAKNRPDRRDREKLSAYIESIQEKLLNVSLNEDSTLSVPGNFPYREQKGGLPMIPEAFEKCDLCGVCAIKCPTGAIPKENPRLVEADRCIFCMACVKACPKYTRKLNPMMIKLVEQRLETVCAERREAELFL